MAYLLICPPWDYLWVYRSLPGMAEATTKIREHRVANGWDDEPTLTKWKPLTPKIGEDIGVWECGPHLYYLIPVGTS